MSAGGLMVVRLCARLLQLSTLTNCYLFPIPPFVTEARMLTGQLRPFPEVHTKAQAMATVLVYTCGHYFLIAADEVQHALMVPD